MPLESPERLTEVPQKGSQPNLTIKVGTTLLERDQLHLIDFLTKNADMFAWSSEEMLLGLYL